MYIQWNDFRIYLKKHTHANDSTKIGYPAIETKYGRFKRYAVKPVTQNQAFIIPGQYFFAALIKDYREVHSEGRSSSTNRSPNVRFSEYSFPYEDPALCDLRHIKVNDPNKIEE